MLQCTHSDLTIISVHDNRKIDDLLAGFASRTATAASGDGQFVFISGVITPGLT